MHLAQGTTGGKGGLCADAGYNLTGIRERCWDSSCIRSAVIDACIFRKDRQTWQGQCVVLYMYVRGGNARSSAMG